MILTINTDGKKYSAECTTDRDGKIDTFKIVCSGGTQEVSDRDLIPIVQALLDADKIRMDNERKKWEASAEFKLYTETVSNHNYKPCNWGSKKGLSATEDLCTEGYGW